MKKIRLKWVLGLLSLFILTSCDINNNGIVENEENIDVMTSIYPMYEITKEIAGDRANISLMVGPSEDAHHYEPSAQAVAAVSEADLFIYSSNEMEFWAESLLTVVENESLEVVELGTGLDFTFQNHEEHENEHEHNDDGHNHGGIDPHFWLNPVAINGQLDLIVDALIVSDPEGAETYRKNAETFSEKLLELDRAYRKSFEDASNHVFVVQHQAFGHLANEYHLDQVAVGGLSTEVEPNPKQLSEIVNLIKEQEVPVIYYQSGGTSAVAETIARETDKDIAVLYDLERAPLDENGNPLSYIESMYLNLEQLEKSIN